MPEYVCRNPKCGITFRKKYRNAKGAYCKMACYMAVKTVDFDIERAITLYESGLSVKAIAEELGVGTGVIHHRFTKAGYHQRRLNRDQRGAKNPSWNGGKRISNGYVKVLRPDHPRADHSGYVFEHIVVAEGLLGRPLVWKGVHHPESEVVHHIDHDRKNNAPENLEVMTYLEHKQHHLERRSSPMTRNFTITVPLAIYDRLHDIARAWDTSLSNLVTDYIKEGLDKTEIRTRAYARKVA